MVLQCQWCGKDFEAKRRDAKYCGRACQNKAGRERARNGIKATERICVKCNKKFTVKPNAYNRRYCYECVPQIPKSGAENRKIIKKWAVEYKGGKCCRCGYNKCIEALDFHHQDPKEKDFMLSDRNLILDWNIIKQELDKCILVCSNCHREIHMELSQNE